MGKRRIGNLQALGVEKITGFDTNPERSTEVAGTYGISTSDDFEGAVSLNPDAMIISTPPDRHRDYQIWAAEHGKHFFTEASVCVEGMLALMDLCDGKDFIAAPSCTMRFHPSVIKMKELAEEFGPVLAFSHHTGQWLPDWHPWEDYRDTYMAKRHTGGALEMVGFELQWLSWVIGADVSCREVDCPVYVKLMSGKLSSLEIDSDDVYQLLFDYDGTLGSMLIDVISPQRIRASRFICEGALFAWDWSDKIVCWYGAEEKEHMEFVPPPGVDMYEEEMRLFLAAVRREARWPYSLQDDYLNLEGIYDAIWDQ
jgi:predicted dehydrogenase